MILFRNDPTPYEVTWYWCDPDALPLGETVFYSHKWSNNRDFWVPGMLGEQPDSDLGYYSGQNVWNKDGRGCVLGNPEDWPLHGAIR